MDLNSILGPIIGIVMIVLGILTSTDPKTHVVTAHFNDASSLLMNFIDIPSVLIVIGGTLACLMVAFPISQFKKIGKHMKIIFSPNQYNPAAYIAQIVGFAKKARVSGLLALEEDIENVEDPFMKSSLMMVVDSVDPDKVKQQMETELEYMEDRHTRDRALYDKGGAFAPGFGMIGTLIGLINLMHNLNDSASVGPNMAVALVTTFYGSLLSNMVFIPVSNKLRVRHEEEMLCKTIVYEGVQGIQAGENPKYIETRLAELLPDGQYDSNEDSAEGASPAKKAKEKKK